MGRLGRPYGKGGGDDRNAPVPIPSWRTSDAPGRSPVAGRSRSPAHPTSTGRRRTAWQASQGQDRQKPCLQGQEGPRSSLQDHVPQDAGFPNPNAAAGCARHPSTPDHVERKGLAPDEGTAAGSSDALSTSAQAPCGFFPRPSAAGCVHKAGDGAKADWNAPGADGPSASRAERAADRAGAVPRPSRFPRLPAITATAPAGDDRAIVSSGDAAGIAADAGRGPSGSDEPPADHPDRRTEPAASLAGDERRPAHIHALFLFCRDARGRRHTAPAPCPGPRAADPGGSAGAARAALPFFLHPVLRSAADDVGAAHRPPPVCAAATPCCPRRQEAGWPPSRASPGTSPCPRASPAPS